MQKEIYGDWVLRCSTHVELLRSRALYHPERRAYTFLADGEREEAHLTFAELDHQARVIAASLQEKQVSGQRVLLLYQPGLDYLAAFFGCLYAGAIAVPAYSPKSNHNLERLEAIVSDAQPIMILSSQNLATATMRKRFNTFSHLGNLLIETTDELPAALADQWREPALSGERLAFLQYTSGSTGRPKGVMVSHQNLLYNHRMLQTALQHPDDAPFVSWLPLFHDMGLIGNALQSVYRGVPCIFMSPFAFLQKPFRWLHAISYYKAYTSYAPNFAYDLCAQNITPEQRATLDLSHWHNALNAAEPVRSETVERFIEIFAPCGLRREALSPGYGLAEATLVVSVTSANQPPVMQTVREDELEQNRVVAAIDGEKRAKRIVSSGHTYLEQEIRIVDPDTCTSCPVGQVGEIWISGRNVTQGYWKRTEETKATFLAYLTDTGEGPFMRTGDMGFLDHGELFVTGRLKDLIIIYGQNHYPQDIELTAEQSHPGLRSNCSAAFSLEFAGEERVILVQEIERQYRHQDPTDIVAAVRQAVLEKHDVHINGILLIRPGSMPKTSSGKIQHRACREALLAHTLPIVFADLPTSLADLARQPALEGEERAPLAQSELMEAHLTRSNGIESTLKNSSSSLILPSQRLQESKAPDVSKRHKNMQFSLLYFSSNESDIAENKYELFLEGARFADQHDFTAVWIPERHFHPFGGLYPNPSVLAAALAVSTTRLRLRAGSVVLPMHHPARVAEEWSVVDNLSAGRVDIAFATGWNPNDFVLAPESYKQRKEMLLSNMEAFHKLWRGEEVTWPNGLGQQTRVTIYPRPKQRQLTSWITCTGNPERFVEAGMLGANVLTGLLFQSVEELAEKIKMYREARARHGHDPAEGHVTLMLHTFVDEDPEEVRQKVRGPFTAYLESSVDLWRQGLEKLDSLTPKERERVLAYAFERYFHTHALFGTPQTCEKMIEHLSKIGVDEIASLIDFGMDTDMVIDGLHWLNILRKRYQKRVMSEHTDTVKSVGENQSMELSVQHSHSQPPFEESRSQWAASTPQVQRAAVKNGTNNSQPESRYIEILAAMTPDQRRSWLRDYLRQQLAQVLERRAEEFANLTNMRSLGLDSLKVMSIVNNCQRDIQLSLDAGRFYELTSLESLTLYIAEEYEYLYKRDRAGQTTGKTYQPLQRKERLMHFPQSFAQQRMWFMNQLQPDTIAYNVPTAISIRGELNVEALRWSLEEIVRRHEILRTTFDTNQGQPVQIISSIATFSLPIVKLSTCGSPLRDNQVQGLIRQEAQRLFNLTQGPLIRATLLWLDGEEHILLLTYHHIVADGWSRGILMRELQALYISFVTGRSSPLEELPIQYADFTMWQMERLQDPVPSGQRLPDEEGEQTLLASQIAYWKKQLAGPLPVLELPTDHPRPAVQTFHGAHQTLHLPEQLMRNLRALSEREGTTLFMTLFASFQVLLARYSGQEDIVIGSPIAGRTWAETEALIGFFVNTLVLRTDLSGNPSFLEILKRVRRVCLDAYAHQEAPFEQIVDAVSPVRDLSRFPLVQVTFGLHEASWWFEGEIAGLRLRQMEIESAISIVDLTWSITTSGFGIVEYNTDLFEGGTIARMVTHWCQLLEAVVADPLQRLIDIPLLTEAERKQILVHWNATQQEQGQTLCLHQLFEQWARLTPTAIALKTPTLDLTYQEVERRANQLAHALCRLGTNAGVRIGVCMNKVPEAIISLLGILKAGGVYVPLDPHYPQERLAFMVEDAQIAALLTQKSVQDRLPEQDLPTLCLNSTWFQQSNESTEPLVQEITPDWPAYIIYTSGSTGLPKGVQVAHCGIQNLMEVQKRNFALRPEDHILQFSSLSFDASIWEVCMSLCTGATLCLARENVVLAGPVLKATVEELAITVATLPPSVLASLSPDDLQYVRVIIAAGEACTPGLVERWSVDHSFFNAYGPTETTVCATMEQCTDSTHQPAIGAPIDNMQMYIFDAALQPVPLGVSGELYIGGVGLAYGYLNRPDLTAAAFVPHPFASQPGERLYKTGDRGLYRANGTIECLGRVDNQVKIHGYRIELDEIEAVLLHYSAVQECVVVVKDTQAENKQLVAYVVLHQGNVFSSEHMETYLQQRLPEYMVPAIILPLERMPLSPNGKIDRKKLPDVEAVRQQVETTRVLPSTASERVIANVWQECLHVEKIGRDENFFELGGHSLLVPQVLQKLQEHFQREIVLTDFFEYPTVSAFARHLDQAEQPREQMAALLMRQEEALKAGKNRLQEKRLRRVKE